MRVRVVVGLALALAGCAEQGVEPLAKASSAAARPAGEGTSFDNPVVIRARNEPEGIAAEYAWIRAHRPGAKPEMQGLIVNKNRIFDVITIRRNGRTEQVYFEISSYFGKY